MNRLVLGAALFMTGAAAAQDWKVLFNGKDFDGWENKGDGQWKVLADGTLFAYPVSGARNPFGPQWPVALTEKQYMDWRQTQSWLYTVDEFGEYDLHVEYRTHAGGNSGISIRDNTRGRYAYGPNPDFTRTPAHNGYEIQIVSGAKSKWPTGSIYLFAPAEFGHEKENDWNSLDIESRNERIRVRLNGHAVASHPGEPSRPKVGPIGLQLHDRFSVMMFRNIRIRENNR
ncbi:MAG: 3-keto-disaccharide hydrolase [Bryobacteraceae bacterium]